MKHHNAPNGTTSMNRSPNRPARLALVPDSPGSTLERWEDEGGHLRADIPSRAGTAPAPARTRELFTYRRVRLSPLKLC